MTSNVVNLFSVIFDVNHGISVQLVLFTEIIQMNGYLLVHFGLEDLKQA